MMKMKIIKHIGFQELVVDDPVMNSLYGCSQKEPIILARITNFFTTKYWKVKDFRLVENSNGNANKFFQDYSMQKYTPLNEDDAKNLKSKLTSFVEKDGDIYWSTKDGVLTGGDKTNDPELPQNIKEVGEGAWSFKEAQKKLSALKLFWENYNENHLENIAIHHPDRQMNLVDYSIIRDKERKSRVKP